MKEWPANDVPANFSEVSDEIVRAIRFAYSCKRKNKGRSIRLAGPDAPETVGSPGGSKMLSAEHLKYSAEDQGRDALTEIVGVCLRLGIEQGRRITMDSPEVRNIRNQLASIKGAIRLIDNE